MRVLYRGAFFYGTTRWIAWLLWVHVVHHGDYPFDLHWGGPYWIPDFDAPKSVTHTHPAARDTRRRPAPARTGARTARPGPSTAPPASPTVRARSTRNAGRTHHRSRRDPTAPS